MSKPIPKGTLCDGDMTTALDSRFLNAIVLQGAMEKRGKDHIIVEIDRVEHLETLQYENGKEDVDVYLLYFKGSDKPLKLNATNLKAIITQHGTMGKNWNGKKIALGTVVAYRPDLKAKGPCVRVLHINPETGKAPESW